MARSRRHTVRVAAIGMAVTLAGGTGDRRRGGRGTGVGGQPPRRRPAWLVVGLPTSDAATALGMAEGTVRKHVGDARDTLRHVLAS